MQQQRSHRAAALVALAVTLVLLAPIDRAAAAAVIAVPGDYPTIKAAVQAAQPGDTIEVAPGTYVENVRLKGRDITLRAADGPGETVLVAKARNKAIILIDRGETNATRIEGFTFEGHPKGEGPAIELDQSSATITGNRFVAISGVDALVTDSVISDNEFVGRPGKCEDHTAIRVRSPASITLIERNTVTDNRYQTCTTSGILVGGAATVRDNIVRTHSGAGMSVADRQRNHTVERNFVAASGPAAAKVRLVSKVTYAANNVFVNVELVTDEGRMTFVNNTVVGQVGSTDPAAIIYKSEERTLQNNLFVGDTSAVLVECEAQTAIFETNIFWNAGGSHVDPGCLNGGSNNQTVDPLLSNHALLDVIPAPGSPAIDAGDPAVAPADDHHGLPRPLDGDFNGSAHVDIGAHEVPGRQIIGKVESLGEFRSGICVESFRKNGDFVGSSITAVNGRYVVPAGSGPHRLRFSDCTDGFFGSEWYENAPDRQSSTVVKVRSDRDKKNIDAELEPIATCAGRLATVIGRRGETIHGSSGRDIIIGLGGDDVIEASGGNDFICAGTGDDTIDGGDGRDHIEAGPGNDTIRGGIGENFIYGEEGNDVVLGSGGDAIFGGPGKDLLQPSPKANIVDGGPGVDRIDVSWWEKRIVLDLEAAEMRSAASEGPMEVSNIEEVIGTPLNDIIHGTAGNDLIRGHDGNDEIRGRGGDDRLFGDAGHDLLEAGEGDDDVFGGAGDDTLFGIYGENNITPGGGDDLVSWFDAPVAVVFVNHRQFELEGVGLDRFINSMPEIVEGSRFDDVGIFADMGGWVFGGDGDDDITIAGVQGKTNGTAFGGEGDDIVRGRDGFETLVGGPGDDLLEDSRGGALMAPEAGNDRVRGSSGGSNDVVTYELSPVPATVDLAAKMAGTSQGQDTLREIEYAVGSDHDDVLSGNAQINIILGLGGDDTLAGLSNVDLLDGGDGFDVADGGPGNDFCLDAEELTSCEETELPAYLSLPSRLMLPPSTPLALAQRLGAAAGLRQVISLRSPWDTTEGPR